MKLIGGGEGEGEGGVIKKRTKTNMGRRGVKPVYHYVQTVKKMPDISNRK